MKQPIKGDLSFRKGLPQRVEAFITDWSERYIQIPKAALRQGAADIARIGSTGEFKDDGQSTKTLDRYAVTQVAEPLDPAELRRVFGAFPSGVVAIAALIDGSPVGMAASSFTSVSLDPPLVMICVGKTSTTWPKFREAPRFGVSVFAADQAAACRQLAARSGDRFADISWRSTEDGAVMLEGATAWLHCSTHAVYPGGDHDIVVMHVHDLDANHAIHPLVFHASKFHRLEA